MGLKVKRPFFDILRVLTGVVPPNFTLDIFASNELSDNDFAELQCWCADNVRPYWATGIGLIDAADIIVSEAVENNNINDIAKDLNRKSYLEKEYKKLLEREKICPTILESESRALLKALQEIAELVGLDTTNSPSETVEMVKLLVA